MIASEDPIVDVPIVFASGSQGALKSLAIIETHPFCCSAKTSKAYELYCIRTILNIGADGVLFVIDEVLGEGIAVRRGYSDDREVQLQ
jgi:hypothetical protein